MIIFENITQNYTKFTQFCDNSRNYVGFSRSGLILRINPKIKKPLPTTHHIINSMFCFKVLVSNNSQIAKG